MKVTVSGAASKTARTEGGRIVFEELPAGTYRLRFEKEGYVTYERELAARGSAPIEVKVTLENCLPRPRPRRLRLRRWSLSRASSTRRSS